MNDFSQGRDPRRKLIHVDYQNATSRYARRRPGETVFVSGASTICVCGDMDDGV